VQGSECLVPSVALLHTCAGEDQCRVKPLQRYYFIPIESLILLLLLLYLGIALKEMWMTAFFIIMAKIWINPRDLKTLNYAL